MKKEAVKYIIAIVSIPIGYSLGALAWSTSGLGPFWSTTLLILSVVLMLFGPAYIFLLIVREIYRSNKK